MTPAGADSRANYLLKWEAIRSSREQGATSYDLWGLAHAGIAHFKTGFGGREIHYVGAYDLVLDPLGRRTYAVAQAGPRPRGAAAPRPAGRLVAPRGTRGTGAATGATHDGGPAAGRRRAGRLGRARRWTPRAATCSSRGPGPRIARRRAGRRGSTSSATLGHSSSCGRGTGIGGGSAYVPRGPVVRRHAVGDATVTACGSASRSPRSRSTSRTAAWTCSPRTRRSPPRTRRYGRALDGGRLPRRSPRSSRPATGWRCRCPRARTSGRDGRASRRRPGSGSAAPSATASSSCAGTRRRPSSRARSAPTEDGGGRPATGSTACCARPATGAASGSPGPRSSCLVGPRARGAGTSSTSRRARARRTATCSAGSCCTATGGGSRPRTAATAPSGAVTTRARCTSSAGARSSSPWPRAGPRWTSAGWTSPAPGGSRAEGEPTYGLYEHKRSFGAEWVALAGAQERVARPWRYALGRGLSRVERLVTPGRTAR